MKELYFIHRIDVNGKKEWKPESIQVLKELFNVPVGVYQLFIKKIRGYTNTRTKYHFGHVLPMVVQALHNRGINIIVDPISGEAHPTDVESLHEYHKSVFNPCLYRNILNKPNAKGEVLEFIPGKRSTKDLDDSEFIDRYETEIISEYATEYGIEFLTREEFAKYMKDGKSSRMVVDLMLESEIVQ